MRQDENHLISRGWLHLFPINEYTHTDKKRSFSFLPSSFNQRPPLHPQWFVCLRQIFRESQLVTPQIFRVLGLPPDQVPRRSSHEANDHWSWSTGLLHQLSQSMHLCHLWKKRLSREQLRHRRRWLFAWCFPQNVQEYCTDGVTISTDSVRLRGFWCCLSWQ